MGSVLLRLLLVKASILPVLKTCWLERLRKKKLLCASSNSFKQGNKRKEIRSYYCGVIRLSVTIKHFPIVSSDEKKCCANYVKFRETIVRIWRVNQTYFVKRATSKLNICLRDKRHFKNLCYFSIA